MVTPAPTQQPLGGPALNPSPVQASDARRQPTSASSATTPTPPEPQRVVVVGGGPRALMLLERIVAHRATSFPLELHVVDPHTPGAGRIWRTEQSSLLRLNSTAADVTIFADSSCTLGAPAATGPSLAQWVAGLREGEYTSPSPLGVDAAQEAARLLPEDFPSRRLHSHYLEWAWERLLSGLPDAVSVRWHRATALRVLAAQFGSVGVKANGVQLDSGKVLPADAVVYAVGHTDALATEQQQRWERAALQAGLSYYRPAFTADADYSALRPGQDVIVRGLGLAAIDLVVLLTEGRGGTFTPRPGHELLPASRASLSYTPSGREPRLLLGSRRGVPYRSKSLQQLETAPASLELLTRERIEAAVTGNEAWTFTTHAWPLIASELHLAHYRELFAAHPERTLGGWEATRAAILNHHWDSAALRQHLALAVPDAKDRFQARDVERPLAGVAVASRDELDAVVAEHLRTDLDQHRLPAHTATLAVVHALLRIHVALAEAPAALWHHSVRERPIPSQWQSYFSYLASGPPPERLEQLLALVEAGVVGFLGPELEVELSGDGTAFIANSSTVAQSTTATALVDAWLPESDAHTTANPALAALGAVAGLHGGRISTDSLTGRVLDRRGARLPSTWALGAPTSTPDAGAFSRPGVNALPFRSTDRAAADIVAVLAHPPTLLAAAPTSAPAPQTETA